MCRYYDIVSTVCRYVYLLYLLSRVCSAGRYSIGMGWPDLSSALHYQDTRL